MSVDLAPASTWLANRGWSVDFAVDPRPSFRLGEQLRITRRLKDGRIFGWCHSYEIPMTVRYAWRGFLRPSEAYEAINSDAWDDVRHQWFNVGIAAIERESGVSREEVQVDD